ncbi:hypothetical protein DY000_02040998 [Brassica cretica]|uniref:Uncharacterized protein n=1 Tax=Brassica cretica TaxID=69181 RepID=A0ABQ7BN39_BRACR|nr:hypothetical protein DY000_02040998 [Brassica cretica]
MTGADLESISASGVHRYHVFLLLSEVPATQMVFVRGYKDVCNIDAMGGCAGVQRPTVLAMQRLGLRSCSSMNSVSGLRFSIHTSLGNSPVAHPSFFPHFRVDRIDLLPARYGMLNRKPLTEFIALQLRRKIESERLSNGLKQVWSRFMEKSTRWSKPGWQVVGESPAPVIGGDGGGQCLTGEVTSDSRGVAVILRQLPGGGLTAEESGESGGGQRRKRRKTAAKAAETIPGGGACNSRTRRGETSGGSSGFVRTLIVAWSVATASSRREEHDGGSAWLGGYGRFTERTKAKLMRRRFPEIPGCSEWW